MRARLYLRPGSAVWYADYTAPDGKRVRHSLGTTDQQTADAIFQRISANDPARAPSNSTTQAQARAVTLHDALAHWLHYGLPDAAPGTVVCYRQRAGHLVRLLGDLHVAELHMDNLHWYIAERQTEGAAPESIRKELCVLRLGMRLAHERGVEGANPRGRLPRFRARYEPKRRWMTPDEVVRLLGELDPARHLWLHVALYTGARLGELERLRYDDIDWRLGHLFLRGTKTKRAPRTIPLHPALASILRAQPTRCGPVLSRWGNVRRDLAAACKRAHIATVSPNDIRRTFASWLKQKGVDSHAVAKLLGHTSSRMVELVYGHMDGGAMARALGELPDLPK